MKKKNKESFPIKMKSYSYVYYMGVYRIHGPFDFGKLVLFGALVG